MMDSFEINSRKSRSVYVVTGDKKRAWLSVSGEASTNKNVLAEIERIRISGASFDHAVWTAKQLSQTY